MPAARPADPSSGAVDPRTIITPDSFAVAPELIGLPLATPARRAAAMLLDVFPLALLINAGAVFFALTAAIVLWRASARASIHRRRRRLPLRIGAAFLLFIVVLRAWDAVVDRTARGSRTSVARTDTVVEPLLHVGPAAADSLLAGAGDTMAVERMRELQHEIDRMRGEIRELRERERERERDERGVVLAFLGRIADDLGIGFGWAALYFTAFLALWNGQTPGKRAVGIRVIRLDGRPIGWWIAFERFGGYAASIWTGLLGFLQILWDRNRQGIHDKLAETVVISARPAHATPPERR